MTAAIQDREAPALTLMVRPGGFPVILAQRAFALGTVARLLFVVR